MVWKNRALVVANVTADSDELLDALRARAQSVSISFSLIVPATGGGPAGREAAQAKLEAALARMREAGLEADGRTGDPDPVAAVQEIWSPAEFDEVIVSTLPTDASRWLAMDLPHRIERMTGVQVMHVQVQPRKALSTEQVAEHEKLGILSPLSTLFAPRGERRESQRPGP
jgi:hypothetical protein